MVIKWINYVIFIIIIIMNIKYFQHMFFIMWLINCDMFLFLCFFFLFFFAFSLTGSMMSLEANICKLRWISTKCDRHEKWENFFKKKIKHKIYSHIKKNIFFAISHKLILGNHITTHLTIIHNAIKRERQRERVS